MQFALNTLTAVCEDKDEKCGVVNGGYPPFWCNDGQDNHKFMLTKCPATCKVCVGK